jgi:cell division protein ZapA
MGQVSVTLNGRTYSIRCADGEEPRLIELATFVSRRSDAIIDEFHPISDDRALLMVAISIADELLQPALPASAPGPSTANGKAHAPPALASPSIGLHKGNGR